ncbi:hypothetical protein B0T26DRAFT_752770 [Lasiosphaeria miniovina]|uniref:Uncharacterized protein n=1 Tax=Lasiosphaeria miniovina TaxID=1954250 RepID=A0AA40AAZ0_9PEZI|nr:uncharacterized protein B0T26DRAFT_752770 [Lasiosphaeria miniovina]KAK0712544.1 hypothetical protein B0T26DRAFT_752770 [Lasiosphaeria miniovina]
MKIWADTCALALFAYKVTSLPDVSQLPGFSGLSLCSDRNKGVLERWTVNAEHGENFDWWSLDTPKDLKHWIQTCDEGHTGCLPASTLLPTHILDFSDLSAVKLLTQPACTGGHTLPSADEVLDRRAWTYQERYLSPRVIRYGASQITCSCRAGDVPESKCSGFHGSVVRFDRRLDEWLDLLY